MQPELFELLQEAKADAPPPRYDAGDALAAGRRLRRRRTTRWAIAAAVAVLAAIGVPQILTRGPEHPARPAPPVATSPAPGSPVTFAYTFRGYDAGEFHVSDPTAVNLTGSNASVTRIGATGHTFDGATLHVYRPGLDPLAEYPDATITEADPIRGRRAFFLKPDTTRGPAVAYEDELFVWEYAEGALALLRPHPEGMTPAQVRLVAEGFALSEERPVTLPFKLGHAPTGYRVIEVGDSFVRMIPAATAAKRMTEPAHGSAKSEDGEPYWNVLILLGDVATVERKAKSGCDVEGCYYTDGSGKKVSVGGSIPKAEVLKTLDAISLADPADPATWYPVGAALPASALPAHP